ncbi:MAG: hypothetical protein PHI59_03720 [Candidatus Omnitrophica bacterium]|nr:hypothetical protein [Candidatus Omnitrophota bacterium]
MKSCASKKGAAFLTTVILIGIAVIASAALSFMLLKDAFTVKRLKASTEAYYLAEAGIEEAIQELWDNTFDLSKFPIVRNLGTGNITVNISSSKWASDNILLITSTGTANGISRRLKTEVKANIPLSFNYTILADKKILPTNQTTTNCGNSNGVHSNSSATGGFLSPPAVYVVGLLRPCIVNGNASAVGHVRTLLQGSITGTKTDHAPAVSLPSFDADFFQYYITKATQSGDIYTPSSGTQVFSSTTLTPANGVIYVVGNVSIEHDVSLTGCIIATGHIWVNFIVDGTFNQTQVGNLPALMSRGGGIWIWSPTTLNGLVYATGDILTLSLWGTFGNININGEIMSKGNITLADKATITYVKQNPPGLGANPIGWILNWQED